MFKVQNKLGQISIWLKMRHKPRFCQTTNGWLFETSFWFYPTKTIGCFGDGGFIYSKAKRSWDRARRLNVVHLSNMPLWIQLRLDELQTALNQSCNMWTTGLRKDGHRLKLSSVCDGKILRLSRVIV